MCEIIIHVQGEISPDKVNEATKQMIVDKIRQLSPKAGIIVEFKLRTKGEE